MSLTIAPWSSPFTNACDAVLEFSERNPRQQLPGFRSRSRSHISRHSRSQPSLGNALCHHDSTVPPGRRGLGRCLASVEPTQTESSQEQVPRETGDAQEALKELDRQLAQLAEGGGTRTRVPIPRVGDTLLPAAPGQDRFQTAAERIAGERPSSATPLGRDANPEGWPEFDGTFFIYSSLVLLVLTALYNWFYNGVLNVPSPETKAEMAVERQEKRARIQALYDRVLQDADPNAPPAAIQWRELKRE